jgi:hypothetical protein
MMLSELVSQPLDYRQSLRDGDLLIMMLSDLLLQPVDYR